jgi:NAD(P)-dependent dehydrogenase (short-subunit alcohol dehydrogenase family)
MPDEPIFPDLSGGVAVVTGAGQGLGKAEALALAAAGARVVVNDLGEAAARTAAEIVAAGGEALAIEGDVGDWAVAASLVDAAVTTFGGLNVLVNNAGVLRDKMIFSLREDDWDAVVRVHLRGHAGTCNAATAYWRGRAKSTGAPAWARVVNTTSESFLLGAAGQPNYTAAKAGITALTMAVAQGTSRYGVRANAIAPRARTAMTAATFPPAPETGVDPFSTAHVTPVVTWLASREADHVNGQVFVVHGGRVAVVGAPTVEAVYRCSGETWTASDLADTVGAAIEKGDHAGYALTPGDLRLR